VFNPAEREQFRAALRRNDDPRLEPAAVGVALP
jgi:hypothetical protein